MIKLRNCPMCGAPPCPEGIILTAEVMLDLDDMDADPFYAIDYTVRCVECGAKVSHDELTEVVNLWNGTPTTDEGERTH